MRESADVLSWTGVTVSGRTLNNLRYADDIVLVATTPTALQQLLIYKVDAVSRDYGLEISTPKTKVMVTWEGRDHTFTCNGEATEFIWEQSSHPQETVASKSVPD